MIDNNENGIDWIVGLWDCCYQVINCTVTGHPGHRSQNSPSADYDGDNRESGAVVTDGAEKEDPPRRRSSISFVCFRLTHGHTDTQTDGQLMGVRDKRSWLLRSRPRC